MSVDYLELADFLLITEAVLQTPAKKVAQDASLNLADSALHAPRARFAGSDFYPEFATKAAVLCTHLIKNHPLKDGNAQVALIATIEFCARNGFRWSPPAGDEDGHLTATRLLEVAASPLTEDLIVGLSQWIAERIGGPSSASDGSPG
ncbi:MAG TPA: Fic family protein [Acidimicrobiales bacterium]|jgi:death-on-curing protein|nr:Fic family protein [Acidimicrobiales bacterium]